MTAIFSQLHNKRNMNSSDSCLIRWLTAFYTFVNQTGDSYIGLSQQ
jgi:hypothetical protein